MSLCSLIQATMASSVRPALTSSTIAFIPSTFSWMAWSQVAMPSPSSEGQSTPGPGKSTESSSLSTPDRSMAHLAMALL